MTSDLQGVLDEVYEAVRPVMGGGSVADYIPRLAAVDPDQFGIAVMTTDGERFAAGDAAVDFSIQSISKVFSLALVMAGDGDEIWQRVNREPSGAAFNSLAQLEYKRGIPRNPFMNAGALVVADHLLSLTPGEQSPVLEFVRAESGNPEISVDALTAASELSHSDRNSSIAHLLRSFGNLTNNVDAVLARYVEQCAIAMTCEDLAAAGAFLARRGVRADGSRLLSSNQARRVNAVMLTSGFYDAAGEFAYRVGLPGKSGVGGGILAIVPDVCSICVWGPGLDGSGNSLTGMTALAELTARTDWSIF
ncbi:glutaminase [Leucobacter aridicollis]|uniref:Glutaminase n=1 Tax=Leucobacter aridicollis TaxID=283878 RepID=A0A852RBJ2_9MICO|nr:glutaminase [Leucobacter aridicollis]MBL3681194.1 glutaminase [Leucobacter aridicollis]NYD27789.1 glutaminase [Leucobacter aridicollis]